ncbi:LifA/Efa1-related large cytotoxin [Chlamydia psittaci]|uniref:LifA/Efa1-related large cytotoxin n=1 Tax=Chlamydia psittaci TaxID=83554 RepID=UPI00027E1EE2|nr:LifA/Efa1-related large cytotoxin [Chlamydia psittaci]AFS24770.1 cysteine protease, YopT-type domain protein [Chlamydia psittaci M56]
MSLPEKISSSRSSQNQSEILSSNLYNKSLPYSSSFFNSHNRITLYNSLVKQDNTTEDVVKIGGLIQKNIHNTIEKKKYRLGEGGVTPSHHTGNWKTSLLYNASRLLAHLFSTTIQPARITRSTILSQSDNLQKTPSMSSIKKCVPSQTDSIFFPTSSSSLTKKINESKNKISEEHVSRRKRAAVDPNRDAEQKYDLTDKNIVIRLQLSDEQVKSCQKSVNNLRKATNRYQTLRDKNSRAGQSLLVKQAEFLEEIQKRLKLPKEHQASQVMAMIKNEYKSHRVQVDKFLHGIWVAGSPPDGTDEYIRSFLEAYDDFKFYLWVDEKAYGAAKFTSIMKKIAFDSAIKKLRESVAESDQAFIKKYDELIQKYGSEKNPKLQNQYLEDIQSMRETYVGLHKSIRDAFNSFLLQQTVIQQDNFFNFCTLKGVDSISDQTRIDYLEKELLLPREEVEDYKKLIEKNKKKIEEIVSKVNKDIGENRVFIKDIKELKSMHDRTNLYNYNTEMFLRWNYAAATDQVRMYMLDEIGGIYTDLDMMPAHSAEVNKIIHDVGGNIFFEDLSIRRAISYIVLKLVNDSSQSISLDQMSKDLDMTRISASDKTKLSQLLDKLRTFSQSHEKKAFFARMSPDVVRDFMPILQRYHKWTTGWNVRGLNGLMMSHKGSGVVEAVIKAQRQAYAELKTLRQNVLSSQFFNGLQDLSELDRMSVVGGALVKDYLEKSLFFDFRQDSIIPGAVSTLGISGPDLITKEMKRYFRSQGPIGEDFLENQGRKLGKEAFLGAYNRLPGDTTHFDWLNPVTIGANDVTPADDSTWCGIKNRAAGDLLFSDSSKLSNKPVKSISRTTVDVQEFTKLWSEHSKAICSVELLQRFNRVIVNPELDIGAISDLDGDLSVAMQNLSQDRIAKEGVFSLQLQLAELVRSVKFPVSNQVNFFPNGHSNFENDLEKAVKLYLNANSQTKIVLWESPLSDRVLFLKDMISISERLLEISNFIDSLDQSPPSYSEINLLTTYGELKAKESLDLLSPSELDRFLYVTTQISENERLKNKIEEIEYRISSGYLYRDYERHLSSWLGLSDNELKQKILSFAQDLSKDGSLGKSEQKERDHWYVEVCEKIYEQRVTESSSRIREFMKKFQQNERVVLVSMDEYLSGHPLFERIHKDGYAFKDFQNIARLILANSGVSGVFLSESSLPAPSKELVNIMKSVLGEDYDEISNKAMPLVYELLAEDKGSKKAKQVQERIQQQGLEELGEKLSPYSAKDLLIPPTDSSVTALGVRYGIEYGRESEHTMVNIAPGIFNPAGYTMGFYLEALYDIHREIHAGSLTKEKAQSILQDKRADCFINEQGLDSLVRYSDSMYYCSLTEVHRILTGQFFLAEATTKLIAGALPGISTIIDSDKNLGRPLLTAITSSPVVNPYDYRGVGLSKDLLSAPHDVPSIRSIVGGAKYTASSWPEFFNMHAEGWSDLANRLGGKSTDIHPQTFLYKVDGRCIGISMLYLLAKDTTSYSLIQDNLTVLSSLYQEKERERLPLTKTDQELLDRSTALIDWLQFQGNKYLKSPDVFSPISWSLLILKDKFEKTQLKSVLITTPNHSLTLHKLGDDVYRLTDPNFGHTDFPSFEKAFYFVSGLMEESYEIKTRYGFSDDMRTQDQIKVYTPSTNLFENTLFSGTNLGLTSKHQSTTLEKMTDRGSVVISQIKTSWRTLYQIGGIVDHQRISETTTIEDLIRLKIDGNVLDNYLSKHVLDSDTSSLIQTVLKTHGLEPGTKGIKGRAIMAVPNEVASLIQTSKNKMVKIRSSLQVMLNLISRKLKSISVTDNDRAKIKSVSINNDDLLTIELETSTKQSKTITFDGEMMAVSFRRFGRMLNELSSTGVIDLDLGMSIVSLVQYARMVEQGQSTDALAQLNLMMNVKAMSELTLGSVIQVMGKKFITDSGVNTFRLESALASKLQTVAQKVGGSTGRALSSAARVLELPVLETVAGVWNLYSSVSVLMQETSYSEQMAARVQVAFDAISLALTLSSAAAPSLILAAGPIAAIGMGAASIAHNVAYHESRHETWLKYKDFLEKGSKNIVVSLPDRGILDLSGNQVLGNVLLDLRQNPPVLTGDPSYNANRYAGHHRELTDRQVRDILCYAYSITPTHALAQGHANSYWPRKVPSIPEGTYTTVILGYGIQYKAVTEVIYLSNQIVWREAVMEPDSYYYQPPLNPISKQTKIIAGDAPLTVIPVRLLDGDSKETLQARMDQAKSYKDYKIIIQGGLGGLVVQIGGAGFYDLKGHPNANNVISFRAIPKPYSVVFDLGKGEQEVKIVKINENSEDDQEYDILKIKQEGFSTIFGSERGYDTLTGKNNTSFYLGLGGGTVYSGLGTCHYHIPDTPQHTSIFLNSASTFHTITLDKKIDEIKMMGEVLALIPTYRSDDPTAGLHLYSEDSQTDMSVWIGKVKILLLDGVQLGLLRKEHNRLTFGITGCDHSKWQQQHPEEPGYPESILKTLQNTPWEFGDEFTLIRKDSSVVFSFINQQITYYPHPYADVSVRTSSQYDVVVEGEEGCTYLIKSLPNTMSKSITIRLKESWVTSAILDLYSLVISSIEGRVSLNLDNRVDLIISSPRYHIPVILEWSGEVPRGTFIEVADGVHGSLGKWYDLLIKDRGTKQSLYRRSMLVAERIESVRSLNDGITLLSAEDDQGDNPIQILGVENKEDMDLQVSGSLQSGTFIGSMENLRWVTVFPSKVFNVTVPARNIKYLSFQGGAKSGKNIVFYSKITPSVIEARRQPAVLISRNQWKSCNQIDVYFTSLRLGDFIRYRVSGEQQGLTRQLMYAQRLVKIEGRDFILRFFYVRGGDGIGSIDLRFKDFFNKSMEKDKNIDDQDPSINEQYREHLNLQLGSETFSLAILATEFLSTHHVINLVHHRNVKYQLEFPYPMLRFPNTNIFAYTLNPEDIYSSPEDLRWLPIDPFMKKYELTGLAKQGASYYLDPESGDLYLTRIILFGDTRTEALLVKFPGYKCKWREFQKVIVTGRDILTIANRETISLSGTTFSGPSIQRIRFDYEKWLRGISSQPSITSIEVGINSNNDQVVHYDFMKGGKHHSFVDADLWDLRDRSKQSVRSKVYDDYLLKEAIHLCEREQQWKVPESVLEYAVGYYTQVASTWIKHQVTAGIKLSLPANSTTISLITSQGTMFTKQQERSGYAVHYRLGGLHKVAKHVVLTQIPGKMLCSIKTDVIILIQKVDESQYDSRNIYVVAEIIGEDVEETKLF